MLALGKHKREAETPSKNNNLHYHFIVQITHHSFSMDSSPALLPVQLPGHFAEGQLVVTDKLVDSALFPDLIPSNQIAIPGPSMISRPMPSGMDLSLPTQSRTSLQDMRILPLPSYGHLLQALPPQYNRERPYITVRLTTSESTWPTSMQSVELSNSVYRTLMESCCCALMDMRTIMEDSPYLLSLVQMGTILLSSSSNWMMEEWQDLAPWQEVSMMLVLSTYLLHWPSMNNPSNPSLTGLVPASGVTPPISIHSMRPSSPLTTGGSLPRSSDTESWTERLPCYRRNLAWWMQTLQHLSQPSRHARTILLLHEWQRRLSQWGSSISNCR